MDSSKSSAGRSEPPTNSAKSQAPSSPKTSERNQGLFEQELSLLHQQSMLRYCMVALYEALLRQSAPDEHGTSYVELRIPTKMAALMLEGLMLAEDGDSDPFGLKRKGRPSKIPVTLHHDVCHEFYHLRGQDGMTYEEALETMAQRLGASERTIANILASQPELCAHLERISISGKK